MAIPSGLRALLSQMGLFTGGAPKQGAPTAGKASAMKAEQGPARGEAMGPEGLLLAGLGYSSRDRRTDQKNVAERSNLTRFLREQLRDGPALKGSDLAADEGLLKELAREESAQARAEGEAGEAREPGADRELRAQERREDARLQGQKEASEKAEARETAEPKEAEQQRQQEEQDEDDRPGAGWVMEEAEDEERAARPGLRLDDALGDANRCRAHLDDGQRCLRKPVAGTPYCREHAFSWSTPSDIRRPG